MLVLVTGGSGSLGSSLCRALLEHGFDVRVLQHRRKPRVRGAGLEIARGDVTDPRSVRAAVDGAGAVVHLAGMVQPLTERRPDLAERVNVGGTRAVVEAIRDAGLHIPFVFTSSGAVFGARPDAEGCLHPDRDPCRPTTVYGRTKVAAEELIRESGIDYLILRLTSIPYLRIGIADIRKHMFTIPLDNRLDFCHPDDAALAIVNSVVRFDSVKGQTLMIGGGPSRQMLYGDMLRVVMGTFGLPLPPAGKFAVEPYPLHWYDTERSQELLRYQRRNLDDYSRDLARRFPAPFVTLMRRVIGPALGRAIVRLM